MPPTALLLWSVWMPRHCTTDQHLSNCTATLWQCRRDDLFGAEGHQKLALSLRCPDLLVGGLVRFAEASPRFRRWIGLAPELLRDSAVLLLPQ